MTATLTAFTRQFTYEIDGGMLDLHYRDGVTSLERWPADGSRPIVFAPDEAEALAKDILADSEWLSGQLSEAHEDGEETGENYGREEGYKEARNEAVAWIEDLLVSAGDEDTPATSAMFRSALEKFLREEQH